VIKLPHTMGGTFPAIIAEVGDSTSSDVKVVTTGMLTPLTFCGVCPACTPEKQISGHISPYGDSLNDGGTRVIAGLGEGGCLS